MGFRVTLLSVQAGDADKILQSLSLTATSEADPENKTPLSGASNGETYIIWGNDDAYRFSDDRLLMASRLGPILMLRANETVMISEAAKFDHGQKQWSLVHDCNEGLDHLAPWGDLPAIWQTIKDDLSAEAAAEDDDVVDFIYDAPVVLFQHLSGFRHDESHELQFVTLSGEHSARVRKPFWKFWV